MQRLKLVKNAGRTHGPHVTLGSLPDPSRSLKSLKPAQAFTTDSNRSALCCARLARQCGKPKPMQNLKPSKQAHAHSQECRNKRTVERETRYSEHAQPFLYVPVGRKHDQGLLPGTSACTAHASMQRMALRTHCSVLRNPAAPVAHHFAQSSHCSTPQILAHKPGQGNCQNSHLRPVCYPRPCCAHIHLPLSTRGPSRTSLLLTVQCYPPPTTNSPAC